MKVQKLNRRQALLGIIFIKIQFHLKTQKLIKEEQIHSLVKVVIKRSEVDIIEKIEIAKRKNKKVIKVVEEINKVKIKGLKEDE